MIEADGPNAEQIHYWNDVVGGRWVKGQERLDAMLDPLGAHALDRIGVGTGDAVLDTGCGCGSTTAEIHRRVGPSGRVTGLDISDVMLDAARARVQGDNVRFENADAQTHSFQRDYDLVFSRFGVMFFNDPTAAFTNLRTALRPGGRLGFICWQAFDRNPWLGIPAAAVAQVIPPPAPPEPGAPGPFSFADPDRVRGILEGAGFTDVRIEPHETEIPLGGPMTLDETVRFAAQNGPAAAALRDAEPATVERALEAIRAGLAPHFEEGTGVVLSGAAWIVHAQSH